MDSTHCADALHCTWALKIGGGRSSGKRSAGSADAGSKHMEYDNRQ